MSGLTTVWNTRNLKHFLEYDNGYKNKNEDGTEDGTDGRVDVPLDVTTITLRRPKGAIFGHVVLHEQTHQVGSGFLGFVDVLAIIDILEKFTQFLVGFSLGTFNRSADPLAVPALVGDVPPKFPIARRESVDTARVGVPLGFRRLVDLFYTVHEMFSFFD